MAAHQRAVGRALLITVFTSSAFQRACSHLTRLLALVRDTPHWTASIDTVLNASLLGFTKCSTGTTNAVLAKKYRNHRVRAHFVRLCYCCCFFPSCNLLFISLFFSTLQMKRTEAPQTRLLDSSFARRSHVVIPFFFVFLTACSFVLSFRIVHARL